MKHTVRFDWKTCVARWWYCGWLFLLLDGCCRCWCCYLMLCIIRIIQRIQTNVFAQYIHWAYTVDVASTCVCATRMCFGSNSVFRMLKIDEYPPLYRTRINCWLLPNDDAQTIALLLLDCLKFNLCFSVFLPNADDFNGSKTIHTLEFECMHTRSRGVLDDRSISRSPGQCLQNTLTRCFSA